jgi:hypothetical protein
VQAWKYQGQQHIDISIHVLICGIFMLLEAHTPFESLPIVAMKME